ncbi:EmrB/QacA subfamily drug resistance transporter [Actinocorallia herbida]|uniref:EmrB/QacA subfamily drug resistance transporter n=1 Tax=Actinocorallia herbida TaxID=58109 RepID=A0A3N1D4Q6_9ACTN|nr:MFS transporter [Actinocorallia herbida]ROO88507.1 EmrB/QacA subfamily drug resistance transporter [Actinocorallia herbida]
MSATDAVHRTAVPDSSDDSPRLTPRLWGVLLVLSTVLFLDGLDTSMVGVTLPAIQADLGMSTSALQWIVSAYVLGYGGLLLLGGRTADLLGRRRVLLVALAVFAAASLLSVFTDSGTVLIATRFIKGLAAAFTAPAGLSILTTTFAEGPVRNKALGIYTVFGASGFSSGLILGGVLSTLDWRAVFLLPAPIALIALVAGWKLIPRSAERAEGGHDLLGAVTATAALLLLVFTLVSAPEAGWLSVRTLGSFALVVALAVAFVVTERRVRHPLVPLSIFRNGLLVRANLTAMTVFGSYAAFQFLAALYLQTVLGWSALEMALALLPAGLIVALSGPVMGRLITRYGPTRLVPLGMVAFVLAYTLFLRAGAEPDLGTVILPTAVLLGFGFALAFSSLNAQATTGVPDDEQGLASGLVQTSFQIGGAVVLAVTSAVVSRTPIEPHVLPSSFRPALLFVIAAVVLGLTAALSAWLRSPAPRAEAEPERVRELELVP